MQHLAERLPEGGKRKRTHLFAYDQDGHEVEFTSGQDPAAKEGLKAPYKDLVIMDHAEAQLAAGIRKSETEGRVVSVINNEPCPGPRGCDAVFADLLPQNVTVELYVKTSAGTRFYGEYQGNGKGIV